ncbi:hypothetical protein ACFQX7_36795 [Luedemannella flava]
MPFFCMVANGPLPPLENDMGKSGAFGTTEPSASRFNVASASVHEPSDVRAKRGVTDSFTVQVLSGLAKIWRVDVRPDIDSTRWRHRAAIANAADASPTDVRHVGATAGAAAAAAGAVVTAVIPAATRSAAATARATNVNQFTVDFGRKRPQCNISKPP